MQHPWQPAEMLRLMNEHLRRSRVPDRFLAMLFAVYDAPERELSLASAGFPPPWRVRSGAVERVPIEGVALGLIDDVCYREDRLTLEPGDLIVFASDGLDEAMDQDRRPFGTDRIAETLAGSADLRPSLVVDALLAATDRHQAGVPAHDDRTIVAIRAT